MKIRFLPLLVAALLLSVATGEAHSRSHAHRRSHPQEIALGGAGADEGGPLARSRGLSQGESAAVGEVLATIASSATSGTDAAAAQPSRRYSPDYYRVYSHRTPANGAKKVAVKPAVTPAPAVQPPPPPVKPPAAAVANVQPVPAKPPVAMAKRVEVAPPAAKPQKVTPAPVVKVKTLPPATGTPTAAGIRMAFAPHKAVKGKVPPPASTPAPAPGTPVRAVFRDQPPR